MTQIKNKKVFLFLTVILSFMLMFSLAGCGDDEATTSSAGTGTTDGSGYIDVDSAGGDGSDDLSKYNEETSTATTGGDSGSAADTTNSSNKASGSGSTSSGSNSGTSGTSGTSGSSGTSGTSSGTQSDGEIKDQYATEIEKIPDGEPLPVEPEASTVNSAKSGTCTLSINCSTILNNMADFNQDKMSVLPSDGVILSTRTVTFYEGESVFDVLERETKNNKIHMEFSFTPMYNSVYVEGINNLYEFDCGKLSGWMYCVNDWYPNYGCSRYQVKQGDVIEWNYTCDLGADLGEDLSKWE